MASVQSKTPDHVRRVLVKMLDEIQEKNRNPLVSLRAKFKLLDKNGVLAVSRHELNTVLDTLDITLPSSEIDVIVNAYTVGGLFEYGNLIRGFRDIIADRIRLQRETRSDRARRHIRISGSNTLTCNLSVDTKGRQIDTWDADKRAEYEQQDAAIETADDRARRVRRERDEAAAAAAVERECAADERAYGYTRGDGSGGGGGGGYGIDASGKRSVIKVGCKLGGHRPVQVCEGTRQAAVVPGPKIVSCKQWRSKAAQRRVPARYSYDIFSN